MSIANLKAPRVNNFNMELGSLTLPNLLSSQSLATNSNGTLVIGTSPSYFPVSSNVDITPNQSNSGQYITWTSSGSDNVNFIVPNSNVLQQGWNVSIVGAQSGPGVINMSFASGLDSTTLGSTSLPVNQSFGSQFDITYLGNSVFSIDRASPN